MKHLHPLCLTLVVAAACAGDDDSDSLYDGTQGLGDGDGDGDGTGDGDGDGDGSGDGDGDGDGGGDGDGDGDGGPLLDVSVGDGDGDGDGDCQEGQEDCYCSSVDILFVVDNSVSMNDYQTALGLAFPDFADSMIAALPNGVDVHVGVTSTTMGYSSAGMTQNCVATGDGDQPQEAFYDTPDQGNNGLNGAQGRLFDPGGGLPLYFEADTDDAASMQELAAWFTEAVAVGTGGSQIEMATAPAGWVADPANDATNAGFVRDEGAVLVVFFLQDEPDQTPVTIDGQAGGLAMLDRLADAKAGCGGTNCIVGGGLVNQYCYDDTPISDFLGGLAQAPVVAALPDENLAEDDPAAADDEMNTYLSDTLALVIGEACENIPPEG